MKRQRPVQATMLQLVQALQQITDNDAEVVAAVATLVNSGKVRLCGNFAGATIVAQRSLRKETPCL